MKRIICMPSEPAWQQMPLSLALWAWLLPTLLPDCHTHQPLDRTSPRVVRRSLQHSGPRPKVTSLPAYGAPSWPTDRIPQHSIFIFHPNSLALLK